MDMQKALGAESFDLSRLILEAKGEQRYLADWGTELGDRIKYFVSTGKEMPIITGRGAAKGDYYQPRVVNVPATKGRRFEYDKLRTARSDLYSRHVTVIEPVTPYTITYPNEQAWREFQSIGWQRLNGEHAEMRQRTPFLSPKTVAENLSRARELKTAAKQREEGARIELSDLIADRLGPDVRSTFAYSDTVFKVQSRGLRREIDLDMAERDAELRRFLRVYEIRPQVRVVFVKLDPEEAEL